MNGILENGYRNSEKGWFGAGVYMTDCFNTANTYTVDKKGSPSKYRCVFVNEVLESKMMQKIVFDKDVYGKDTDTDFYQFHQHTLQSSPQPTEKDYKKDSLGRRYRNVAVDKISAMDEYVARARVTIPRYLVVYENKRYKKRVSSSK